MGRFRPGAFHQLPDGPPYGTLVDMIYRTVLVTP
jgi:hypothetical protein